MNSPAAARRAAAAAGLLSLAALTAACGSASPSSPSSAPSTPATPTSTAHAAASGSPAPSAPASGSATTPATAAGCATSSLKAVVDVSKGSGAAGSVYYPINFTNTSSSTCTLYGYPGVSFATGQGGSQIGSPASRNPTLKPVAVTLAPGAVAHATIQVAQAGNYSASQCKPVTAHWLKIYPPNQTAALYATFTTQACSGTLPKGVGAQLSVYAVRAGAGTGTSP